jgi:hypothetical protein
MGIEALVIACASSSSLAVGGVTWTVSGTMPAGIVIGADATAACVTAGCAVAIAAVDFREAGGACADVFVVVLVGNGFAGGDFSGAVVVTGAGAGSVTAAAGDAMAGDVMAGGVAAATTTGCAGALRVPR